MGEVIVITSGKGGTGKTSTVGAVGSYLAQMGKRVLCIDCDTELRNLDVTLGMSESVLTDFSEVLDGTCSLEEAAAECPGVSGLYLLTAPIDIPPENIDTEKMKQLIEEAKSSYDYCLMDSPAGIGAGFRLAAAFADRAIVVAAGEAATLRDVQRVVMELGRMNIPSVRLIINRVKPSFFKKLHTGLDGAIDTAGAQLIGVVPEDMNIPLSAERGVPLTNAKQTRAAAAYKNIAGRITGKKIPLTVK